MKRIVLLCILVTALTTATGFKLEARNATPEASPVAASASDLPAAKKTKIQLSILLDTSGSMQGLIEQAKSRLWNIVNTLTTLKYKGVTPDIEDRKSVV